MDNCRYQYNEALITSVLEEKREVILWGTAQRGRWEYYTSQEKGIPIRCFCDSNKALWGTTYMGLPVISVEEAAKLKLPVVLCTGTEYYKSMIDQGTKLGITEFLPCYYTFHNSEKQGDLFKTRAGSVIYHVLNKKRLEYLAKGEDRFFIETLNLNITDRCTLRCKECTHLITFFQNPKDEGTDCQLQALNRLASVCDTIGQICVLGGEPLLNKDLPKYITEIGKMKKVLFVRIVTNGTIIPSDEVCMAIKNNPNVCISVSNYGDHSTKIKKVEEKLKEFDVPFYIEGMNQKWNKASSFQFHEESEEELCEKYRKCRNPNTCWSLKNGKFYLCTFIPYARALQAIPKEVEEGVDFADLSVSEDTLKQQYLEYLGRPYLKGCQYCDGYPAHMELIPAAEQIAGVRDYKIYEE